MSTKDYFSFAIQLTILLLGCFFTGYFLLENWQHWFDALLFKDDKILLNRHVDYIKLTVVLLCVQFFLFILAFKTLNAQSSYTKYDNIARNALSKIIIFISIAVFFIYFLLIYAVYAQFLHAKILSWLATAGVVELITITVSAALFLIVCHHNILQSGAKNYLLVLFYVFFVIVSFSVIMSWILDPVYNFLFKACFFKTAIRGIHVCFVVVFAYLVVFSCQNNACTCSVQYKNNVFILVLFALGLGMRLGFGSIQFAAGLYYCKPVLFLVLPIICCLVFLYAYHTLKAWALHVKYDNKQLADLLVSLLVLSVVLIIVVLLGMYITMECVYILNWVSETFL